ncbi:MAG: Yip1 protein [Gemmatimonadetes bacterium]|nr:Yip1 protein [Gemmatimonadota bacterium]
MATISAPAKSPGFWEDVIDIFFQPTDVFRRRQDKSVWPPMLFVAISIAVIFYATFNTLEPLFDAEFARNSAKVMAKNPQMTAEMMDKMRGMTTASTKYGIGVVMLITMFLLGSVAWLVGKLFGSKQAYHAALVVAAWAYMPRVVGTVINGVQGLMMDPAKLNGALAVSLSPARFMDPDTANPIVYQLMGRLDLITLWVTVLLGIGFYVTGKVSKEKAVAFAIVMFVLGALPALRQAYLAM